MGVSAKFVGLAFAIGMVATGCSHSGYPLSRDYHNMSHRDLSQAYRGSHAGYQRGHSGVRGRPHHRHFGHPQGLPSEQRSGGYYSRDYRSGNGYHGRHHYGRRLPNGWTVSDRVRLDPWLNNTGEGQKFVRDHYDVTRYGTIDEDTAENANVFFRRWADIDRDYRLTDEEIRTALRHTAHDYGLPDARPHHYPPGHMHRERTHRHGHQGHHRPAPPLEPIIEEAPQIPYGERG